MPQIMVRDAMNAKQLATARQGFFTLAKDANGFIRPVFALLQARQQFQHRRDYRHEPALRRVGSFRALGSLNADLAFLKFNILPAHFPGLTQSATGKRKEAREIRAMFGLSRATGFNDL